jgi:hypothetical protein
MNLKGNVKVEVVVGPGGAVKSVEIKGGHPVLAKSAENAVFKWKWESAAGETRELVEMKFNPEELFFARLSLFPVRLTDSRCCFDNHVKAPPSYSILSAISLCLC